MVNHILLEVFCLKDSRTIDFISKKPLCNENQKAPTYECLFKKCPFCTYTSHENALCYVNDKSYTEKIVSLGGEMLPEGVNKEAMKKRWKSIASKKIEEAYLEYMNFSSNSQSIEN